MYHKPVNILEVFNKTCVRYLVLLLANLNRYDSVSCTVLGVMLTRPILWGWLWCIAI